MVEQKKIENVVGTRVNPQDEQKRRNLLALQEKLLTGKDASHKVTLKGDFPDVRTADKHVVSKDEKQKFKTLVDLTIDRLKNTYDALMNLHKHFDGTESQPILNNTKLQQFLKGKEVDLGKLIEAWKSVRKASDVADQASTKWRTSGDITKFIDEFQKSYQPFNKTYQKLLAAHNEKFPDKSIEVERTETTEEKDKMIEEDSEEIIKEKSKGKKSDTKRKEMQEMQEIRELLLEKGDNLSGTGLEKNENEKWWKRSLIDLRFTKLLDEYNEGIQSMKMAKGAVRDIVTRCQKDPDAVVTSNELALLKSYLKVKSHTQEAKRLGKGWGDPTTRRDLGEFIADSQNAYKDLNKHSLEWKEKKGFSKPSKIKYMTDEDMINLAIKYSMNDSVNTHQQPENFDALARWVQQKLGSPEFQRLVTTIGQMLPGNRQALGSALELSSEESNYLAEFDAKVQAVRSTFNSDNIQLQDNLRPIYKSFKQIVTKLMAQPELRSREDDYYDNFGEGGSRS